VCPAKLDGTNCGKFGSTVYLAVSSVVNTYALVVENITAGNEILQTSGMTTNSEEAFDGCNYTMKDIEKIYIKGKKQKIEN
jgi:hypothetical protein